MNNTLYESNVVLKNSLDIYFIQVFMPIENSES